MATFIFDIGDVLIDNDLPALQQRLAASSNLSVEDIKRIWAQPEFIAVETGKISGRKYFKDLISLTGLDWRYQDWIQAWADIYTINNTGMDLMLNLKRSGHGVNLLSNLAEYNKEAIDLKFPHFLSETECNFFSFEVGYHKPDPRIYKTVYNSLSIPPDKCVFIDDMAENVEGAISAGMTGIVFSIENIEEIKAEIARIVKANPPVK
jgi:putative hydrolase of the HAD superfamily